MACKIIQVVMIWTAHRHWSVKKCRRTWDCCQRRNRRTIFPDCSPAQWTSQPVQNTMTGFDDEALLRWLHLPWFTRKRKSARKSFSLFMQLARPWCDPEKKFVCLGQGRLESWGSGIVAGRLWKNWDPDSHCFLLWDGRAWGSARSVEAVDVFEALDPIEASSSAFGGHAGGAGLTTGTVEQLSDLSGFEDYVCEKGADAGGKE